MPWDESRCSSGTSSPQPSPSCSRGSRRLFATSSSTRCSSRYAQSAVCRCTTDSPRVYLGAATSGTLSLELAPALSSSVPDLQMDYPGAGARGDLGAAHLGAGGGEARVHQENTTVYPWCTWWERRIQGIKSAGVGVGGFWCLSLQTGIPPFPGASGLHRKDGNSELRDCTILAVVSLPLFSSGVPWVLRAGRRRWTATGPGRG